MQNRRVNDSECELCQFYKEKISKMQEKFVDLWNMLRQSIKKSKENQNFYQELQLRTSEVSRLQMEMSNLQVFLMREREENLRLAAENDHLRIQRHEFKKQNSILLKLSGLSQQQFRDLLLASNLKDKNSTKAPSTGSSDKSGKSYYNSHDFESKDALSLQVKSLKTQLENVRILYRNEVDVLLKDREVVAEERSVEIHRLNDHISILNSKLRESTELLHESMAQLLHVEEQKGLKYAYNRASEGSGEEDDDDYVTVSTVGKKPRSWAAKTLHKRIQELEKMVQTYQQQCRHLDAEMKKFKLMAENAERTLEEKTKNLTADLTVIRNRYQDLDRRRLLEGQGYRTDIKCLRERLAELDKKINKIKLDEVATSRISQIKIPEELEKTSQEALKRGKHFERELNALKLKISKMAQSND